MKISLNDINFTGEKSFSKMMVDGPKSFQWERSPLVDTKNDLVVFTDLCLSLAKLPQYKDKYKIALLLEPPAINLSHYQFVKENYDLFDLILTHQIDLLSMGEKYQYSPNAMSYIQEKDWKIWPKIKSTSIIASAKNYAEGHKLRHILIEKYKNYMDVYGYGYNPIEDKADGLKDYMFSVAIENSWSNGYWSEKILDCFLTGTVPIYLGDPQIAKTFNPDGIFGLYNAEAANNNFGIIIDVLHDFKMGKEQYDQRAKAIQENFEIAKELTCGEDWIYKNILKPKGLV